MKQPTETVMLTDDHSSSFHNENQSQYLPLTIELLDNEWSFGKMQSEWDELAEVSSATIFQTHEWLSLWWKHFGGHAHKQLHILIFRHKNMVVGIAPLFVQEETILGICLNRRLSVIGSGEAFTKSFGLFFDDGPTDYLDVLIMPRFESSVTDSFLSYLKQHSDVYDEIQFLNISQESNIYIEVLSRLDKYEFSHKIWRADRCPRLLIPASLDEYIHNRSASIRRRLLQARKAAVEETAFAVRNADSSELYKEAMNDIIRLHQERWNRLGYPGLFAENRFQQFQEAVINAFHAKGWLWCKTAYADGKCIAGRLAFKFNNCYYDYLSGFDDTTPSAKRRPGIALLLAMIDDAINDKYTMIDLLRGDEQYKSELTSEAVYNWNIVIRKSNHSKSIQIQFYQFVRLITFLGFLLARELKLVKVQYRKHNFPFFIFQYIKFRSPRFNQKMSGIIKGKS